LIFLLVEAGSLWSGETMSFDPQGLGAFFFSDTNPIVRSIVASEKLILDFGEWTLILDPDFIPSGETLLQVYYDFREESSPLLDDLSEEDLNEFVQAWEGGFLTFSPLTPDRLFFQYDLYSERHEISLSERPSGILLFFEAGETFFWLGNGKDFFCYDGKGKCLNRESLTNTALQASADREGNLYLTCSDGLIRGFSPLSEGESGLVSDRTFSYEYLIMHYYEEARSLLNGDVEDFDRWVRRVTKELYREDPLNREMGVFLRSLE
jgi:hypothetical protein